jgi:hypothetical protein
MCPITVIPEGIHFIDRELRLYWLLKNVGPRIDLNWMSTAPERRDFPAGTRGSHMAEEEEACFLEVNVRRDAPHPRTYLLGLSGSLRSADYRRVPSAEFSGLMYGLDQDYSRFIFQQNSGEYIESGADSILRYSAPAYQRSGRLCQVLGLFPEAAPKLKLEWVQPIGLDSPEIPIVLFNGNTVSSGLFPRPPIQPEFKVGG